MKAHPSFQFYPSDWLRDPGLRSCSLAARGLWIDMLGFMHEAEPYGHLCLSGQDISPHILARMVGTSAKVIQRLLTELETAGVFSRNPKMGSTGMIYSRRMVRDQALREKRGQYGHLSENHPLVPRKKEENDPDKDTIKDSFPPSLHPSLGGSPSSSSSSSSSSSKEKKESESAHAPLSVQAKTDQTAPQNGSNGHAGQEWQDHFERFWTAFPKKKHKGKVEQWFKDHHPPAALVDEMLAKIAECKTTEDWQEDKGKWVPYPAKWLAAKGWEDQVRVDVPPKRRMLMT